MDGTASLYLGSDWLLYVDSSARYKPSEMLAPCMLLAQPGGELAIRREDGRTLRSAGVLHGPNVVSSEESALHGAAFLYLDPLSEAGHAVAQARRVDGLCPWPLPHADDWSASWFDALASGTADGAEVARWVTRAQHALGALASDDRRVDRRLRAVASALAVDTAGRLSIAQLANQVHWSDEHLRKVFRDCVGLTLSRYQMWCRIHRMLSSSCGQVPGARGACEPSTRSSLEEAGFYDIAHGNRALRRYFGLTPGATLKPAIRRADCRAFGARNARASSPFRTAAEQTALLR